MNKPSKSGKIFGIQPVKEAVLAGKSIDKVLIKKGLQSELFGELFKLLRDRKINFQYVPQEKLNHLSGGNHQGIIAFVSPIEFIEIADIIPYIYEKGEVPFILVLDEISDVRNFGAIARTAECAGVHAIIIPFKGSAAIGADAMKTSAGALSRITICKSNNLPESIKYLKTSGLQILAADEKAEKSYLESDFTIPTALIMGSEETGIQKENLKEADSVIRIPMNGEIQSLNVSVATGILLFEGLNQRKKNKNHILV
ncbi:MAG: 23S rRNA (guanosine(2251)-2'-O)-methyltransferase RlmB [Bacteroidales bacterium]|nr:23S rRNA (guanosine(2251)-2'-O)-methyltransferase RlmB [Bacteroidales bacterium]